MYSSFDKAITKARKGEYDDPKSLLEEDAFIDNTSDYTWNAIPFR